MRLYNMPLNVEKWMASPSVRDMSRIEQGAYLVLLLEAWSRDCKLDKTAIEKVKKYEPATWAKAVDRVISMMFSDQNQSDAG